MEVGSLLIADATKSENVDGHPDQTNEAENSDRYLQAARSAGRHRRFVSN
jgi:hypothetical protein